MDVPVMRLRAGLPAQREGAIFLNFGGPGADPWDFFADYAIAWANADTGDPVDGPKRMLADRFDLITVFPRGIAGDTMTCDNVPSSLSLAESSDEAAWKQAGNEAHARALGCQHALRPFVTTRQLAGDLDHVREALAEEHLNFFGVSYGAWLGAWYATRYPSHVGRMLFDSSPAFHLRFDQIDQLSQRERERHFLRDAVGTALRTPERYGLGVDRDTLMVRLQHLPAPWRMRLLPNATDADTLVAAVHLGEHADHLMDMSDESRKTWIDDHDFGIADEYRESVRRAAHTLVPAMSRMAGRDVSAWLTPQGIAVNLATVCADTPWPSDEAHWRSQATWNAKNLLTWTGDDIAQGLYCAHVGQPSASPPRLDEFVRMPRFMMMHAEYDVATPLRGASQVADTIPNAHLVVVRGMRGHGVLGHSRSACVERAGPLFLLTGALPDAKHTSCEFKEAD